MALDPADYYDIETMQAPRSRLFINQPLHKNHISANSYNYSQNFVP